MTHSNLIYNRIVPGKPNRWRVWRDSEHTENPIADFSEFLKNLSKDEGVFKVGSISVCNHLAEWARLVGKPAIFSAYEPMFSHQEHIDSSSLLSEPMDRDQIRTLIRVEELVWDNAGNIRNGCFYFPDWQSKIFAWTKWEPSTRFCLNGFRVELVDSSRAGMHIRIGAALPGDVIDRMGYRQSTRFISSAKPYKPGVYILIPSDPIQSLVLLEDTSIHQKEMLALSLERFFCTPHSTEQLLEISVQKNLNCYAKGVSSKA